LFAKKMAHQQQADNVGDGLPQSIFVADDGSDIFDVPISVIRRPIPSVLDEGKVWPIIWMPMQSAVRTWM
jgi:hypothetical protein